MSTVIPDPAQLARIRSSFPAYCEYMLRGVFELRFYHRVIMDRIQAVLDGTATPKLGIFMPPRHGKSTVGAALWLSYMFGCYPRLTGAYATFNEEFAEDMRNQVARILYRPDYMAMFPGTRLRDQISTAQKKRIKSMRGIKNTAFEMRNALSERGRLLFVGRGSALTGRGLHYGVCDDLYKGPEEYWSDKIRTSISDWFWSVWMTRFERKSKHLLFYTRWGEDDVAGNLMRLDEDARKDGGEAYTPWNWLRFPAYKDDLNDNPYDTRALGEPLDEGWVHQYVVQKHDDFRFQALYQQNPVGTDNLLMFRDVAWREYRTVPTVHFKTISVDTTFGNPDASTVDEVAMAVHGLFGNQPVLLPDFISRKMSFEEMKDELLRLLQRHPDTAVTLVEDSAVGRPLCEALNLRGFNVMAIPVGGKSKRERAHFFLPFAREGRYWIPERETFPQIEKWHAACRKFTGLRKTGVPVDLLDAAFQAVQFYDREGCFQFRALPEVIKTPLAADGRFSGFLPPSRTAMIEVL